MKRVGKKERIWAIDEADEENYVPFFEDDEFNEPVTLELGKPIKVLEVETTEIIINPPSAGQMMEARSGKGTAERRNLKYFAQCCNLPLEIFTSDDLRARDLDRIGQILTNFIQYAE